MLVTCPPCAWAQDAPSAERPSPNPNLYPLFYTGTDPLAGRTEQDALGPLFTRQRARDTSATLLALRPVFSQGADASGRERFWDFFYPLAGSRRVADATRPGDFSARRWVLPLYFQKTSKSGDRQESRAVLFPFLFSGQRAPGSDYLILFPFFWSLNGPAPASSFAASSPPAGRSLALWPFWGHFRGHFGADELHFLLWPLWIRSVKGPDHTTTILWPFLSRTTGPEGIAWRAWPLWSRKRRANGGEQTAYLWPLGHHIRRPAAPGKSRFDFDAFSPFFMRGVYGDFELDYFFPLYGRAERPGQRTDAWLWPLFIHTRHERPAWSQTRLLYVLASVRRGETSSRQTFFPFYSRATDPGRSRLWVLFPFFTKRLDRDANGREFARTYLFPFYLHERWSDPAGRRIKERRALLPFFRSVERADGSREFAWPHLGWYAEQPALTRNWAPFWTVYSSTTTPDGLREQRLLGWLWQRHTRIKK